MNKFRGAGDRKGDLVGARETRPRRRLATLRAEGDRWEDVLRANVNANADANANANASSDLETATPALVRVGHAAAGPALQLPNLLAPWRNEIEKRDPGLRQKNPQLGASSRVVNSREGGLRPGGSVEGRQGRGSRLLTVRETVGAGRPPARGWRGRRGQNATSRPSGSAAAKPLPVVAPPRGRRRVALIGRRSTGAAAPLPCSEGKALSPAGVPANDVYVELEDELGTENEDVIENIKENEKETEKENENENENENEEVTNGLPKQRRKKTVVKRRNVGAGSDKARSLGEGTAGDSEAEKLIVHKIIERLQWKPPPLIDWQIVQDECARKCIDAEEVRALYHQLYASNFATSIPASSVKSKKPKAKSDVEEYRRNDTTKAWKMQKELDERALDANKSDLGIFGAGGDWRLEHLAAADGPLLSCARPSVCPGSSQSLSQSSGGVAHPHIHTLTQSHRHTQAHPPGHPGQRRSERRGSRLSWGLSRLASDFSSLLADAPHTLSHPSSTHSANGQPHPRTGIPTNLQISSAIVRKDHPDLSPETDLEMGTDQGGALVDPRSLWAGDVDNVTERRFLERHRKLQQKCNVGCNVEAVGSGVGPRCQTPTGGGLGTSAAGSGRAALMRLGRTGVWSSTLTLPRSRRSLDLERDNARDGSERDLIEMELAELNDDEDL